MQRIDIAIGIDIGGSHIKLGLITSEGKTLKEVYKSIDRQVNPEELFSYIVNIIKSNFSDYLHKIKGLSIGMPGNIDTKKGICYFSPNFEKFREVNVVELIKKELPLPIIVLNDVTAAAYGELLFGKGKGIKNFVVIFLGTGIGGGIVIDGKVIEGRHHSAGEVGHITLQEDGPLCECGNKGCLEALASSKTIQRLAYHKFSKQLSAKEVYEKAKQGDKKAKDIFNTIGKYLGLGIANIAIILDPDKVILGGGVAKAAEFFLPQLKKELKERIKMFKVEDDLVQISDLKEDAIMLGAAAKLFL